MVLGIAVILTITGVACGRPGGHDTLYPPGKVVVRERGVVEGLGDGSCAGIQSRVDCGYVNITEAVCNARGCCYDGSAAGGSTPSCFYAAEGVPVKKVHVIQGNHFDAGFTNYTYEVLQEYFDTFIPRAIALHANATALNSTAKWLTQSFVVDLFLNCPEGYANLKCPNDDAKAALKAALQSEAIYVHAYPTNAQLELSSPLHIREGIRSTAALLASLDIPPPISMSQRDVPGLIRPMLPAIAAEGVEFVTEGSNAANIPPLVPPAFVWRDEASNTDMLVSFHAFGYGSFFTQGGSANSSGWVPSKQEFISKPYMRIPGFDEILVYEWKVDNTGPAYEFGELQKDYDALQKLFPEAIVEASTIDAFAKNAIAFLKNVSTLPIPIVTKDIGDTWIQGAPSDPVKLANYRAALRAMDACATQTPMLPLQHVIHPEDCDWETNSAYRNFSRLLQKATEHTFGVSTAQRLGDLRDHNFSNVEFHALQLANDSRLWETTWSWLEQRKWCVEYPLSSLPPTSSLLKAIQEDMDDQVAHVPPDLAGFTKVMDPTAPLQVGWARVTVNQSSTALIGFQTPDGKHWASPEAPLGLFLYQSLSFQDYVDFCANYMWNHEVNDGFAKLGMRNMKPAPQHNLASPTVIDMWTRNSSTLLIHGEMPGFLSTLYGSPQQVWITYDFQDMGAVNITLAIGNKTSTRIAEALFFSFNPPASTATGRARPPSPPRVVQSYDEAIQPRSHPRQLHAGHSHSLEDLLLAAITERKEECLGDGGVDAGTTHTHHHSPHTSMHSHHRELHHVEDGEEHRHDHNHMHEGEVEEVHGHVHTGCGVRAIPAIAMGEMAGVMGTIKGWCEEVERKVGVEQAQNLASCQLRDAFDWSRLAQGGIVLEDGFDIAQGWQISTLGEWKNVTDFVGDAGAALQGAGNGVKYTPLDAGMKSLAVMSFDAGVVRFGPPSPFPSPINTQPDLTYGANYVLFENVWNVNFPLYSPFQGAAEVHDDQIHADYKWRFRMVIG